MQSRLAVAATALGLAAPLALAAGSAVAAAAILLAGLLPVVVLLDGRGEPHRLGRSCVFVLLITGAVLAGGALRGLPVAPSILLVTIVFLEAFLVAGRRARLNVFLAGGAALAMTALAGFATAPQQATQGLLIAAVAALAATNAVAIVVSRAAAATQRLSAFRHRLWALRRGAFMMSEATVAVDHRGSVTYVGRNVRSALGLSPDALLGKGLSQLTQVADRPLLLAACWDAFSGVSEKTVRFRLREDLDTSTPRYRWVELKFSGSVQNDVRLASLRDVSEAIADEQKRDDIVLASQRAEAARGAFLSTVNHELRTPLNAIIGFSEFLANPLTTPSDQARVREYAGIIHDAGQDMLRKVSTMIEITRLQSGAVEHTVESADVNGIVLSTVGAFLAESGLPADAIEIAIPTSPTIATIDQRGVSSALVELLDNAFKHGLGKKASVAVRADGDGVTIAVVDHGPGAPLDRLALLNQDLSRSDETLNRTKGGLGLGLTLARCVMAQHGGSIALNNRAAGGAEVVLKLPLKTMAEGASTLVELAAHRKVLQADVPSSRKKKRA